MSRIDRRTQLPVDDQRVIRDRLDTAGQDLRVEPTDEPRRRSGYLTRLRTVTLRPPELRLNMSIRPQTPTPDIATLPEIARITRTETAEFAFAVAELAWRLEADVAASGDAGARDGLAVLSRTARMYEHLFVLQTESEG